jgi:hypothetical protein
VFQIVIPIFKPKQVLGVQITFKSTFSSALALKNHLKKYFAGDYCTYQTPFGGVT